MVWDDDTCDIYTTTNTLCISARNIQIFKVHKLNINWNGNILPSNLQHHDIVLSFVSTTWHDVNVYFWQTAGMGVSMTPTTQTACLHPRRAHPGTKSLQACWYGMKLKRNDMLVKYAEIQFIYNHLQGTLYMYYSDLLTKGRIEFMCNSRWDKCIKKNVLISCLFGTKQFRNFRMKSFF